jgi:hypothetical protein
MARFVDLASGHSLELPSQRTTFGSAPDNHIPMAEGFDLCPRHFQVMPVPGGTVLVDMTGQQATLLNHAPVSQAMLKNGDIVTAGKLSLRYESIPVPPPLPPELPPDSTAAGNTLAPPLAGSQAGGPEVPLLPRTFTPRSSSKAVSFESGGTSSMPNVATAIHLYKWMLPVLGLILWAGKWCYNIYAVKDGMEESENRAVAYALVETFREAREARAPLIENVHDAKHAVRVLLRGVHGSGEYADVEFKVDITRDAADDALEMLMWSESAGLTFKHEHRERSTNYEEQDDTTIEAGAEEDLISLDDI